MTIWREQNTETTGRPIGAAMSENGKPLEIRALRPGYELRASEDGGMPTMFGHFAVFNRWTEINSVFEGHFLERVVPGAFRKTFRENRDRIRALFQHGQDPQIGDKPLGTIEDLREDETGGYYEVELLDTEYNRELLPGLEAGLYGASFRFQVMREDVVDEPEASSDNPRALPERSLKELRLFEFGPVTFPAYAEATAGVRSLTDRFIFDQFERNPDRVRALLAMPPLDTSPEEDNAPSKPDADSTVTSGQERRASRDYLTDPKEVEEWQL